jgi:hypothetical protein
MHEPVFSINRVLLSDVPCLGREIEIQEYLWMAFGQLKDDHDGFGSKLEELNVIKMSPHYPNDQTPFGTCEKVRRRPNSRHWSYNNHFHCRSVSTTAAKAADWCLRFG